MNSHLIAQLVGKRRPEIRIVDDLSPAVKLANIRRPIDGWVEFRREDLPAPGVAQRAVEGMDVVFHLAAIHAC